ncbi:phage tail sheath subtilisin-like domain-containing protein [Streptomyces olivoreticuli]
MSNVIEVEPSNRAPGVEVREVASGVRFVGAAPTAVAAILAEVDPDGRTPGEPKRIATWQAFEKEFTRPLGTPDKQQVSDLVWASVYGWFANGGGVCYIVPVSADDESDGLSDSPVSWYAGSRATGVPPYGLEALESIEDITIILAPDMWTAGAGVIHAQAIVDHCVLMGNRVAVLHNANDMGAGPDDWQELIEASGIDGQKYATAYHPWVRVLHPNGSGDLLEVPPSGHVAGVWARVDGDRGVHKAPANEGLRGVVELMHKLNDPEQAELNDIGVNVIRSFPGAGLLVWGARTLKAGDPSDVESSYLNVRRTVNFIKQSILQSTRWVVFEPNDDRLQSSVTAMVTSFLMGLWRRGMLVGKSPEQAFRVLCNETNNPPEDVLQGRLRCEVGVAIVRPAEFITFEVSQILEQSS